MLGRFLELSVVATDVAQALEFYEALGFVQAHVGEAWKHSYAVVTDGRLYVGLHGLEPGAARFTFVTPDLRTRLEELAGLGVEIEHARLDDVSLNEAEFRDPTGLHVRLVEARTFSPPALEPAFESALGYFEEFVVGANDLPGVGRFWEQLSFVALQDESVARAPRLVATHRDINLAFHDLDVPTPMLRFSATNMTQRIERLKQQGYAFAPRVPRALQAGGSAVLQAPDGVQLLLVQSEA